MTEAKKQIDLITEKLDQNSSQVFISSYNHKSFIFIKIKRFINFVNSHKKPTSEQQENFNTNNVSLLSGNENISNQEAKSEDPESKMSTTINKKSTKLNVQDEEEEEEGEKEEQVNKKNKHRKTKNDSKSIKLKISKERNVKESKDKTPTPTTTVIAQIHATDNHDEIHNNDDNDDKHNLDSDKILKKVKSSKRLKTSSKKLKTSEDENEISTKKKKKSGKKLKDKNKSNSSINDYNNSFALIIFLRSHKTNKLNDDGDDHDVDDDGNDDGDDDDNLPSNIKTTLKLQDNQKLTELSEIETDDIKEIELENEATEIEDNINQVQPFQTEKTNMKKEKKEEKNEIIKQITSQNVLQVHNEILKNSPVDIISEPVESRKCENIDLDNFEFIEHIKETDDGWWLGENIQGKQGLVPMNFLKKIVMVESEWENLKLDYIKQKNIVNNDNIQAEDSPQTYSEDGYDDEDADELLEEEKKQTNAVSLQEVNKENTEVKSNEIKKTNTVVNQIPDYTEDSVEYSEQTWENDEKEGEGDETSENFEIEEEESEDEDNNVEENNVEIIEEGKAGITQSSKLMHSSKSLTSTPFVDTDKRSFKDDQDFAGWYIKNNEKALEAYQPLPSSVRLSFLSLPGKLVEFKITRRQPRWQKIITIQKITQLSILEESNLSILNCLVRLCLFDGIMPISNICYLPITPTDREKKTWIVTPHNSNQPIELSLGWVTIPLYDENGQIIPNKTCDYQLQDSLPFENGKGNKTSVKDVSLKSRMQNLLFNKTTQVTIRFSQPNKEQQDKLNSLPDILIGLVGYAPFLSYHRDFLANIFPGFGRTDDKDQLILRYVQPEVALFPIVADCPLLIECLRKDSEYLKKLYSDHFRRVIYPLLWLQDIEFPCIMSSQQFENESAKVLNLTEQIRQNFMKFITSNQYTFKLFTSKEFNCPIQFTN
ncbi:nephrocystin-1 [Schistosoma bovis]|uniref:Nephrocystin-1 n=1 Tax=Schistosoma bovis TaxID=6184 RepID=A0A430QGY5_SCHBO|nr:nephrocystin-1 [Schistosoma bovis]